MKKTSSLLIALMLASCGTQAPSPTDEENPFNPPVSGEEPVNPVALTRTADVKPPTRPIALHTDGLRVPDMLGLPQDEQLRSAPGSEKEGKATVIARPPEE